MKTVLCIVLYLIGFYIYFRFYLKRIYMIMAVNKVAIPTYKKNKDIDILPFLTNRKNSYLLIIGALIISMFYYYAMIVSIPSFILSLITAKNTFNKNLFADTIYDYAGRSDKNE